MLLKYNNNTEVSARLREHWNDFSKCWIIIFSVRDVITGATVTTYTLIPNETVSEMTILLPFWPFFAICMLIFQKTEIQKVILMSLAGLNSGWFKSYGTTKCKYFHFRFCFFRFCIKYIGFLHFCVLCCNFCTNKGLGTH